MRLREAMVRVVENRRAPDTAHIIQTKVELQRQTRIIRGILARRGKFSFNAIFGGEHLWCRPFAARAPRPAREGRDPGVAERELRRHQGASMGNAQGRLGGLL